MTDEPISQNRDQPARRNPAQWLLPPVLIVGVAISTGLVFDGWAAAMRDQWPDWLDPFAQEVTSYGKSGWILISSASIAAIAAIAARGAAANATGKLARRISIEAATLFLAVALSGLTANLLKRVIGRARPVVFDEWGLMGFSPLSGSRFESFPSGHSTTAGAAVASLALIWPRLTVPFLLAGATVAFSRIVVGAHYPSDVVAGFGYGIWWALMTRSYMRQKGWLPPR